MLNLNPVRIHEVVNAAWLAVKRSDISGRRWCGRIERAAHELETNPWLELDPQGRLLIGSSSGCCYAVSATGTSRCQCEAYHNRRPCWHRAARELAVRCIQAEQRDAAVQMFDRGEADRPDLDAITPPTAPAPLSVADGPFCRDCGALVWDGSSQCAACQNSADDLTLCPDCGDPTSMAGRTYPDAMARVKAQADRIAENAARAEMNAARDAWLRQPQPPATPAPAGDSLADRITAMRRVQADIDECFNA